MAKTKLSIYRLPLPRAAHIGQLRVVIDRNQQVYLDGSKVISATTSGEFLILTLANDQVFYVRASDYRSIQAAAKDSK